MLTVCGEYNWLQKERGAKTTEKMRVYGYIRVSSREQNVDRQLMAMHRVHIPKRNIFIFDVLKENGGLIIRNSMEELSDSPV